MGSYIGSMKGTGTNMNTYIVALHNKLTGERGILGMVEVSNLPSKRRNGGLYKRAELFPLSIAARAAEFREIKGERESIVEAYGPEIES